MHMCVCATYRYMNVCIELPRYLEGTGTTFHLPIHSKQLGRLLVFLPQSLLHLVNYVHFTRIVFLCFC